MAVTAGAFGSLDSALNIAFPDLTTHFDLDVGGLQWVIVCFVLAFGGPLLAAGQLGDRLGHRRVLAAGAALTGLAFVVCALAPTFGILLAGRVLQGLGTALVMASAPALLTLTTPHSQRGRALGRFQTAAAVGLAAGPIIGGPLVAVWGWPAVFWFRVPLTVLLIGLSRTGRRSPLHPRDPNPQTDILGGAVFTVALVGALLMINGGRTLGWTSPLVGLAAVVTVAAVAAIPAVARRSAQPVLDPRLIRRPGFTAATSLAVLANGAMFVTWLLMPSLLVDRIGWSVLVSGVVLALSPAATAVAASIAGRQADRGRSTRLVLVGLALEAAGLATLGIIGGFADPAAGGLAARGAAGGLAGTALTVLLVLGMVGAGFGLGLFLTPNMATIMSALPDTSQGVAGGLNFLTRTTGIVASVGLASALFVRIEITNGPGPAFRWVFLAAAALLVIGAALEVHRVARAH